MQSSVAASGQRGSMPSSARDRRALVAHTANRGSCAHAIIVCDTASPFIAIWLHTANRAVDDQCAGGCGFKGRVNGHEGLPERNSVPPVMRMRESESIFGSLPDNTATRPSHTGHTRRADSAADAVAAVP